MSLSSRGVRYSVSAISTLPSRIFESIAIIDQEMDRWHVDVMDGSFVPRFGLYPEFVQAIREQSRLPIDIHMMVEEPERYLSIFSSSGATRVIPHVEATRHVNQLVLSAKNLGLEVGLAVNPGTDLSVLRYVLDDLEVVTLMAINPGILGQQELRVTSRKLAELTEMIGKNSTGPCIEVDGGVTFSNLRRLADEGAHQLVVGAGTIFSPAARLEENIERLSSLRFS